VHRDPPILLPFRTFTRDGGEPSIRYRSYVVQPSSDLERFGLQDLATRRKPLDARCLAMARSGRWTLLGNGGFSRESVRPIHHRELPPSAGRASLDDPLTWLYTLYELVALLLHHIWSLMATSSDEGIGRVPKGSAWNSGKQQRRDSGEY